MTERIDHAAEAVSDIRYADEVLAEGGDSDVAKAIAAVAQVHATLALVEQQRIANLIALTNRTSSFDEDLAFLGDEAANGLIEMERTPATPFGGPDEHVQVRADIRDGLGL